MPIPPGDVAAAPMPAQREADAYLNSRLDQFYAELQVPCSASVARLPSLTAPRHADTPCKAAKAPRCQPCPGCVMRKALRLLCTRPKAPCRTQC